MPDAVRGIIHGTKGIQKQANFIPVEVNNGAAPVIPNFLVAVMSVASIIVEQYYMTQINSKLNLSNFLLAHFINTRYSIKLINPIKIRIINKHPHFNIRFDFFTMKVTSS